MSKRSPLSNCTEVIKPINIVKHEKLVRELLGKGKKNNPPKKKVKKRKLEWYIHFYGEKAIPSEAENRIRICLQGLNVNFESEVSFRGFVTEKKVPYRYDFYIPGKKIAIEYDGKLFHKSFERKQADKIKNKFCKENGIRLFRFNNKHWDRLECHIMKALKVAWI